MFADSTRHAASWSCFTSPSPPANRPGRRPPSCFSRARGGRRSSDPPSSPTAGRSGPRTSPDRGLGPAEPRRRPPQGPFPPHPHQRPAFFPRVPSRSCAPLAGDSGAPSSSRPIRRPKPPRLERKLRIRRHRERSPPPAPRRSRPAAAIHRSLPRPLLALEGRLAAHPASPSPKCPVGPLRSFPQGRSHPEAPSSSPEFSDLRPLTSDPCPSSSPIPPDSGRSLASR